MIAAIHAGWNGAFRGVVDKVIKFSFENNKRESASAAVLCGGSSRASLKCMDRVLKDSMNNEKKYMANAAAVCAKK